MTVCNTFEGLNLEIPVHENCWPDGVKIVNKAVYYSIYNDINTYQLINEKISISSDHLIKSDHISNTINISRSYDILYDLSVTTDSTELLSVIYSSINDVLYQIGLSRIICEYVIPKLDLYLIGNGMKYKLADSDQTLHYKHIIPIVALPYTQLSLLLVRTLDNANNGIVYTFTAKGGYISSTHRNKLRRSAIKLVDIHDEWKTKLVVSGGSIEPIVYSTSL